jgi:hypothetical protein
MDNISFLSSGQNLLVATLTRRFIFLHWSKAKKAQKLRFWGRLAELALATMASAGVVAFDSIQDDQLHVGGRLGMVSAFALHLRFGGQCLRPQTY